MGNKKYEQYQLVIEVLRRLHSAGVLHHLILVRKKQQQAVRDVFRSVPSKWQKHILQALEASAEVELAGVLAGG